MSQISWSELFPTKLSILFFISYILLFVNQGKLTYTFYYYFITKEHTYLIQECFEICFTKYFLCFYVNRYISNSISGFR